MIWSRYILKEALKVTALVFFSLFMLATLLDFSAHMKTFWQDGVTLSSAILYYLAQLSRQADLLLCMALLLATVKVLSTSNAQGEITALVASGIPLRRLTYPLLILGGVCMTLLYFNIEVLQPHALAHLTKFEENFFKSKGGQDEVLALALQDNSTLLYGCYDANRSLFCDLFWVKDHNHVLRMEEFSPEEKRGYNVDTLERVDGELTWVRTAKSEYFPEILFERRALSEATLPADWQTLGQLWGNLPAKFIKPKKDFEAKVIAAFLHKLCSPLLALLVVIAPAPFCLSFARHKRLFLLYALCLAALLAYFVCTQAALILGKSHVIPPLWVIPLPPVLALTFFGVRYAKL
ncbi:MAG: LptF/LptG family permease [Chlamydiales bacterium]|nr:LptF/LptG family permease [Chlamydiales bacterium]